MTKPIRKRTRAAEGKKWFHTGAGVSVGIFEREEGYTLAYGPFETFEGAKADLRMQIKGRIRDLWDAFKETSQLSPE
jgi:hypothetical protein